MGFQIPIKLDILLICIYMVYIINITILGLSCVLGTQWSNDMNLTTVVENLNIKKEKALKELIWNKEQYLDSPLGEGMNFLDSYQAYCFDHTMYSEHLFRFHLNQQANRNSNFLKGVSQVEVVVFDNIDDFLSSL